ncbi:uncharacterized protein LOC123198570 isoform X2 [Mangifera indica]|uniref:uncharacterized protein LOC123198570 isoform X2 n=1 Tax=Mangifera indica TaxID=29780 RepID=UPI001CFA1DF3|nr:uncharacterized protein LOC123198570 isoform X2 [Mangifera indica]XP_044469212.1 uncharacterized protein LOC123198570 isoform X2 [Mangifera indica]
MFTEGLDGNALKWVRQGGAKKDIFSSIPIQRSKPDGITNLSNGSQGTGMPFSSGLDPVKMIHLSGNDSGSGSDMDISPDSDDEVFVGQHSVKYSPQDDNISNGVAPKYGKPLHKQVKHDNDRNQQKQGNGGGRHATAKVGFSDSATSIEVSFTQFGNDSDASLRGTYTDGYSSSVTSLLKPERTTKQELHSRELHHLKHSCAGIPSALPFVDTLSEIEQVDEHNSTVRAQSRPFPANSSDSETTNFPKTSRSTHAVNPPEDSTRTAAGIEVDLSTSSLRARIPTFHASGLGPWCAVISYDACVRLCLNSWAKGCGKEAPYFLNNECAVLRSAFGLQKVLLQSEEELLEKQSPELVSEAAAMKPKKTYGKMKVEVRKVKMGLDPPPGCNFSSLKPSMVKVESFRQHFSNLNSRLNSGWGAIQKVRVTPGVPKNGTLAQKSLAYVHASSQYVKAVSKLLRNGVATLSKNSTSYEVVQETYSCMLRLKSMSEENVVRMQPGTNETHVFFPDSIGDDLIVEVQGSKGECCGRVLAQVAAIADDPSDKIRWWPIYHEPEHELVGRIQLHINYSTIQVGDNNPKCGCVAETVAYDFLLEVSMKAQKFQQRNLLLNGPWKWLLDYFASYYGVSDTYAKLRYLSYVMDVATPTHDCLTLVYDLLLPVKEKSKSVLSHQENRILRENEDQVQQLLASVFENYKSLDDLLPSGFTDDFGPATGHAAPALEAAVRLYILLNDISGSEAQLKLTRYFQAAVKKRSRRHLKETDEFVYSNNEGMLNDRMTLSIAYQRMKSLILNFRNEICTDIEIHSQDILPSFIDLPNLSASIYSVELCNRLQAFLIACPAPGLSSPVSDLVIATADFQRDLSCWKIDYVKGGVNAKELFHVNITSWIHDKHHALLDSCKLDKVKWAGVRTQNSTTPFIDDMYDQLQEMLNEYEIIIYRWPKYAVVLENAVADVERAIIEALCKRYADVLSPLKDYLSPKKFGLKYVQKIANRSVNAYFVPDELGILLNSMKRILDVLWPKIESQFKLWSSSFAEGRDGVIGEHLTEIAVMMRAKFRNFLLAIVEKLADNTRMQSTTKLKKIIQESKEACPESDIKNRMQPLKDLLVSMMDHLHTVVEPHVFRLICRLLWDHLGEDVLHFLENKREHSCWYKSSRIAISVLDDIFMSQMQQLLGNALQEKDLEPPRSILEVRSMLCKDSVNYRDNNFYW